ncbi:CCR4-NOT transcription complex subunit 7 [Coniochaeta sp. 2T2.1]|nr:CCR4-NOT transcription complex subunit 7 [Coniochaeta sp. 2T2.1]
MPPPPNRFPSGPNTISPYHQQFPSHSQQQQQHTSHGPPPMTANPNYMNANAQMNAFAGNGNLLALGAGLNTTGGAGGFGGLSSAAGDNIGLASHAARMGFAQAGHIQQQQQQAHPQQQQGHVMGAADHPTRNQAKGRIREVWKHNLHEEMKVLRDLVDKYPYVAMDTEFPGIVSRPMGGFRGKSDYHYQCLRTNVDMLKIIQIGLSLFNEDGQPPPAKQDSQDLGRSGNSSSSGPFPYAWQFNFKFSLKDDMFNETSIESLRQAGIDFAALERDGIDPHEFASLLIPSGLVCFDNVHWISFHGGYDFGYLTKLMICRPLPNDEVEFDKIMKLYFPSTYDVKHLLKHAIKLHNSGMLTPADASTVEVLQKFETKSGLENIGETLKIKRVGSAHQAGSDSLLTGRVFFALREKVFNGEISEEHLGKVWGLGIPDFSLQQHMHVGGSLANATTHVENTPPNHSRRDNNNQQNGSSDQNGGTPSTPNTGSVGLASTPAGGAREHQQQQHNAQQQNGAQQGGGGGQHMGPMTPGGGGGVFGAFAFGGNR